VAGCVGEGSWDVDRFYCVFLVVVEKDGGSKGVVFVVDFRGWRVNCVFLPGVDFLRLNVLELWNFNIEMFC
jgi:hypothetical protein